MFILQVDPFPFIQSIAFSNILHRRRGYILAILGSVPYTGKWATFSISMSGRK